VLKAQGHLYLLPYTNIIRLRNMACCVFCCEEDEL